MQAGGASANPREIKRILRVHVSACNLSNISRPCRMLNTRIQDYLFEYTDSRESMSLLRAYTPKYLYKETLCLVNIMFHRPPSIPTDGAHSYFQKVLSLHNLIRADLNDILPDAAPPTKDTTVKQVHGSLVQLEQQLFGSQSEFDADIRGCCVYTRALVHRLSEASVCRMS